MTDTQELRNMISKSGLRTDFICSKLGVTYQTLRRKINNESEFTASEISIMVELLHLSDNQRNQIFFASEMN